MPKCVKTAYIIGIYKKNTQKISIIDSRACLIYRVNSYLKVFHQVCLFINKHVYLFVNNKYLVYIELFALLYFNSRVPIITLINTTEIWRLPEDKFLCFRIHLLIVDRQLTELFKIRHFLLTVSSTTPIVSHVIKS